MGRLGPGIISSDDTTTPAVATTTEILATSQGGFGQDVSTATGLAYFTSGVASFNPTAVTDRAYELGTGGTWTGFSFYDAAMFNISRTLDTDRAEAVVSVLAQSDDFSATATHDKVALYSEIQTAAADGSYTQPAIAVYGNSIIKGTTDGRALAGYFYAHHAAGAEGTLVAVSAETRNIGTVGNVNKPKAAIWLANHLEQVAYGIAMSDGHLGSTYGWETGWYMNDCGFAFVTMNAPTGYPFGTAASTIGIAQYNDANWKAGISVPVGAGVYSNSGAGSLAARLLIQRDATDTYLDLGASVADAETPANFSATKVVSLMINGVLHQIPATVSGAW